ncbi:MAG: alanine--tRNA ligase-related protein, partial [Pseudomonadota bacterium]
RKMDVDREGFNAAMARQKDGSRNAWAGSGASADGALWFDIRASAGASEFSGYTKVSDEGVLAAIVQDGAVCETAGTGPADLVFQRTPFYAESGGQAADRGEITWPGGAKFIVRDVQKRAGDVFVHSGELVEGTISTGSSAHLTVDPGRRAHIMSNHSATHLVHAALRERLGLHVTQKGSLVEADRLRFDFSHGAPVTSEQIDLIEKDVNEIIRQNGPVEIALSSPEAAIAAGALALFGEKYGQEVRVLTMGTKPSDPETAYSIELCGGTHVARTGDIGAFTVLSEQGVSAGIRRIEAATGARALAKLKDDGQVAADVSAMLKVPLKDVVTRLSGLVEERRKFEREIAELKRKVALSPGTGSPGPAQKDLAGVAFIGRVVEDVGAKDLRALVDEAKAGIGSGVCAFVGVTDGKAAVSVGVTADLTERISAVDLVRAASQALGGKGGGGRPDMAQAGGPRGDQADAALDAIGEAILRAGEA